VKSREGAGGWGFGFNFKSWGHFDENDEGEKRKEKFEKLGNGISCIIMGGGDGR